MTRQTWTAAVSALCFLLSALAIAMVPVPFVTYAPGGTHDLLGEVGESPVIDVQGVQTYRTTGQIHATTVAVTDADTPVALPEVLYAHYASDRAALPRTWHYPSGASAVDARARDAQLLNVAQTYATASALRSAGFAVDEIPMVQSVASAGPAVDKLFPGDFLLAVDGTPTPTVADARAAIENRGVGETVTLTVLRERRELSVTIETAASNTQAGVPVWGGNLVMGYSYSPRVRFTLDAGVGGSSGGLMLALAIFDRVTEGHLVGERVVAGTGAIDGAGNVAAVNGVREKLAAAERAGATVFLVPTSNCPDLVGHRATARVVSVGSLDDAIGALDALADPATADLVKGCS